MQATLGAFASLAVLVVLFCGIVVVMSQTWALPLFACASVAVPIATYGAVTALSSKAERKAPQTPGAIARGRGVPSATAARSAALRREAAAARRAAVASAAGTPMIEEPVAKEPFNRFGAEEPVPFGSDLGASELELEPAEAIEACESAFEQEAIEVVSETESRFESEPVFDIPDGSEQEKLILASEPEPEPEPEPAAFDPASYFDRATVLRDKGLFVVAARLYAECASLADDRAVYRKAAIEEIACYVKAGRLDRARSLAAQLKESAPDLTAVETIKIDAVLKAI